MATLKAKKLDAALAKAKNVGRAELPVTIDGCSLVLQNLTAEDYEAIADELQEIPEGPAYVHGYQTSHICRSIVEIDGVDLRGAKYIEDEVPAGNYLISGSVKSATKAKEAKKLLAEAGIDVAVLDPDETDTKTLNLERHEWIRQKISTTWGREAIFIVMKKFADVTVIGQQKAQEGITFSVKEESYADRFRRLLAEAKAMEAELPPDMVNNILLDAGYLQKTSEEELKAATERMKDFQAEQAALAQAEEEAAPAIIPQQQQQEEEPENAELEASLRQMMQRRQPLNRAAIAAPITAAPPTRPATPPAQPAIPARVPPQLATAVKSRSASISELEGQLDPHLMAEIQATALTPPTITRELSKPMLPPDGAQIVGNLDKPPAAGINPRFRPPPRT